MLGCALGFPGVDSSAAWVVVEMDANCLVAILQQWDRNPRKKFSQPNQTQIPQTYR
jgi:hypothetical protein